MQKIKIITLDERYRLIENRVMLDGTWASIGGAKNNWATIITIDGTHSCEFSWQAVARICKAGGNFRTK